MSADQKPKETRLHAWPKRGEPTTCCGRQDYELPLSDGRTTDLKRVTCDGTFTPAVFAHVIYADPGDNWTQPPALDDAAKYHAARALALTYNDLDNPGYSDRAMLMLTQRSVAWHVAALARGLSGQEAMDWVHLNDCDETSELLYDLCRELGVDLTRIRPYAMPRNRDEVSR